MMRFNGFYGFSLFGFIGLIVILLYIIFNIYLKKNKKFYLRISTWILSTYLLFVLLFSISANINITLGNIAWYLAIVVSAISEIIIYFMRKLIDKFKLNSKK